MEKEGKDQGTRTKGIFSEHYMVNFGGGGGSPCHPSGYPSHNGSQYPVHGYPVPAPPPTAYPGYGGYHHQSTGYNHQTSYHSPPHVPAPAYSAYPHNYGGHGGYGGYGKHQQQYHGGYEGYGKHQQQHVEYYHNHEEFDMHQQGYGGRHKNHGYGKHHFGISRGISDAKV